MHSRYYGKDIGLGFDMLNFSQKESIYGLSKDL